MKFPLLVSMPILYCFFVFLNVQLTICMVELARYTPGVVKPAQLSINRES